MEREAPQTKGGTLLDRPTDGYEDENTLAFIILDLSNKIFAILHIMNPEFPLTNESLKYLASSKANDGPCSNPSSISHF